MARCDEKMEQTIYLPFWSKSQLETSDNASIWAEPIPYAKEPTLEYSLSYTFDPEDLEDNEGINPTDDKMFYPDRTAPDMTLERLVEVDEDDIKIAMEAAEEKKVYGRQALVGKHQDALFRCFYSEDSQRWAMYKDGEIEAMPQNVYRFLGFGSVSPYTIRQQAQLEKVLLEGVGLALNPEEVILCDGSYDSYGEFDPDNPKFEFSRSDLVSIDGVTYKLFHDHDNGARGWALFVAKSNEGYDLLAEDHCDNVWDRLEDPKYIEALGFKSNFKFLRRDNFEFWERNYEPTKEDFEEDFHLDENGKKSFDVIHL
jgi:hypothetical protein